MRCRHSSTQLVFNQMDPSRTHEEMGKEKSKETGKEIGQLPPKRSKRNKTDGAQKEGGRAEGKKKGWVGVLPSWVLVSRCREWWSVSHSSSSLLQRAHAAHTQRSMQHRQRHPLSIMGNRPGPWPWWTSVLWSMLIYTHPELSFLSGRCLLQKSLSVWYILSHHPLLPTHVHNYNI